MDDTPRHQKKIYRILLWILLVISLLVLNHLTPTESKPKYFRGDDFMTYWAGGKFILSGENPNDTQKKALQIAFDDQVIEEDLIPIILNPPWVVILKMLFSKLSYPISRLVWLLFLIGSIILSTQLLWRSYNSPPRQQWIDWTIVILYTSSICVLRVDQFLTLTLLAITLFLYFTILQKKTIGQLE
jgi:hypothetical protein